MANWLSPNPFGREANPSVDDAAPPGWASLTSTHGFEQVSTPLHVIKRELLEAQQRGDNFYFFTLDAYEAAIKAQALGPKKIRSLTMADVRRIAIR